jgi:hypothetical protein
MTSPLSQETIQRLAFVRFLHEQGVAQSLQPEPMSAAAILSFQDAVEHFLLISADHLGVSLPNNMHFLQFWEKIQPKLPSGQVLPSKSALGRVNRLRVDLKHYGNIPSSQAIAQSRADVTTFFTDATQLIFGVGFNTVDMVDLVAHPGVNRLLRDAHTYLLDGNIIFAMGGLALAFEELLQHYTSANRVTWRRSPFSFGDRLKGYRPQGAERGAPAAQQLQALTTTTAQLQEAMQVISLGIDYAKYVHFSLLAPGVNRYMDGKVKLTVTDMQHATTVDDYHQARHFVIQSALQAARADAVFERLGTHFPQGFDADIEIEEWTWDGWAGSEG